MHFYYIPIHSELPRRSSSARCRTVPERRRTLYSQLALDKMEAIFEKNPYPDLDIREILSQEFGVPESKIQVRTDALICNCLDQIRREHAIQFIYTEEEFVD